MRATQYLPGIARLQQQMYDISHRRLDRKEASQLTINNFIGRTFDTGTSDLCKIIQASYISLLLCRQEHKKKLFLDNLACVKNAWFLVKEKLSEYCK